MAWIETLPNGKYRACWRDEQGRRRSRSGYIQKAKATREANAFERNARIGAASDDGRAPTWSDWADEWFTQRVVEPSTERQDKVRLDRYLRPHWGKHRVNKIRRSQVQTWVNQLSDTARHDAGDRDPQPLSPATVDRIYRLFSASMKAAVLDEGVPLSVSPCVGIKLPTAAPGHERYLTRGELDLVVDKLDEPYKTAAILLAGTGLRFGELAGLHWQRVDLAEGMIDVVETWDSADRSIKGYPKGKKRRSVPVPGWVRAVLEAQAERTGDHTACGLRHSATARCRSGLVVPAPGGGALDAHNFGRRDWAVACDHAGIGHVRLHDLRHTYASWLRQAGVDLEEVQRLLGHASITTTQRYSHLGSTQHARVIAALEG
jgi:integrase